MTLFFNYKTKVGITCRKKNIQILLKSIYNISTSSKEKKNKKVK